MISARILLEWMFPAVGLLGLAVGCNEKEVGPKRTDHKAAHTARPDLHRNWQSDAAGTVILETQPGDEIPGLLPSSTSTTLPAFHSGSATDVGPIGSPVMFVNGEPLTVTEILEPIIDDLTEKAQTLDMEGYRAALLKIVREEINRQVSSIVVYHEAKKAYTDEKIQEAFDKEADKILKEVINRRFGGVHARYEAHLKALDFTVADMKERAKRQVMVVQFLRERFRPMMAEPRRRELMNYYQSHLKDFASPEKAELFLIEVPYEHELNKPVADCTPAEIDAIKAKIREQLRKANEELAAGVEFTAVAKAYSKGLKANQGGVWGQISPGTLTGRWGKAADVLFTLEPGQNSDIVETPEAMFIVGCGKKTPANQISFEEAQEKIISRVLDEQFSRLRSGYIASLLRKATIQREQEFFQAVLAAAPPPTSLNANVSK